MFYLILHKL